MNLKESKEHKLLRDELVKKLADNLVQKLELNNRLKCKPISLEVHQRKLIEMKPVNQIKPFNVHIHKAYKREIADMLEAGILVPCDVPTE